MLIKTEGSASRKSYAWEILHLANEEKNIIYCPNGTMVKYPHYDPLLISVRICGWDTNRVYIGIDSNTNLIFKKLLDKLKVPFTQVKHSFGPSFNFRRDAIPTLGVMTLTLILIGTTIHKTLDCHSIMEKFLVLDLPSSINAIIR